MEYIDLTKDTIKILGIYFYYDKKLKQEKNAFGHIVKIQNILKLQKPRNLTIEGNLTIVVFKSMTISEIIHLALVTKMSV